MATNYSMGTVNLNGTTNPVLPAQSTSNVITSDSMKPVTPVPLANPNPNLSAYTGLQNNAYNISSNNLNTLQSNVDAMNSTGMKETNTISQIQSLLGGKDTELANALQTGGANDKAQQTLDQLNKLRGYQAQLEGLKIDASLIPDQIQQDFKGTGATDAGVRPFEISQLRANALQSGIIARNVLATQAVYQGNLDAYNQAKDLITQQVNAKYAGYEAEIAAKQTNLQGLIQFGLSPANAKLATEQQRKLKLEDQQIQDAKEREKQNEDMLFRATSQNAPSSVVNKAKQIADNGGSPIQIATALGEWAGDYYGTRLKIATYQKTLAETAKTKSEMVAASQTSTGQNSSEQAKFLLDTVKGSLNLADASGRSAGLRLLQSWTVGATDYTNLDNKVRTLKTNLLTLATDPNIKKYFGPQMTENDVKNMLAAASTLDPEGQTPEQMKAELKRVEGIFQKFAPGYTGQVESSDNWADMTYKALTSPTSGGTYGYADNQVSASTSPTIKK